MRCLDLIKDADMALRVCSPGLGPLLFGAVDGNNVKVSVVVDTRVENLVRTELLIVVAFIFYVYANVEYVIGIVLVEVAVYLIYF